jgi:uncharacterized protein (DUF2252 family)
MSASPLAFLRGAAPLYYELLKERPELAKGPRGEGWLSGDQHLENFGAYRPDAHSFDRPGSHSKKHGTPTATFNLNDFDDAIQGPWRLDVLRLTASLLLGGRELGADGARALDLCYYLLGSYTSNLFGKPRPAPVPRPVQALVDQVCERSSAELLDGRTVIHKGRRRFVRGDRYRDLPRGIAAKVPAAFAKYAAGLDEAERPEQDELAIVDAAFRVAGTGSLGGLRVAVLVQGKGGTDGAWIFDMKEQGTPSASILLGKPSLDPAKRVVTAMDACLEHPPRQRGTTTLGRLPMFVRRLSPQEDKLDLSHMHDSDLNALAVYLGALLGSAHRRGVRGKIPARWSSAECEGIVSHAISIAGIHEATYLALCKLMRR